MALCVYTLPIVLSLAAAAHSAPPHPAVREFVTQHCLDCHSGSESNAGLALDDLLSNGDVGGNAAHWEQVVRRLRTRQMPPSDASRPSEADYGRALRALEAQLDAAWQAQPNLGRTASLRRMTRTEYGNAIRDLLHLQIDTTTLLPADPASHGFDNITVGELSPTHLNRYVSAAQQISRLAVGRTAAAGAAPGGTTFRVPADLTQEQHLSGLPIGTRGGTLIRYTFPADGEYEIRARLARDRNEHVEGLHQRHEVEFLLDRKRLALLTVRPPGNATEHQTADKHLQVRFAATAGPAEVGVTFLGQSASLIETRRQPYQARFNMHRHPRTAPAVFQVSISGPYNVRNISPTPSRKQLFICYPGTADEETACAKRILQAVTRRAYRRPVTSADMLKPLELYRQARESGGDFESGIEMALAGILVSPQFLFRIEREPADVASGTAYAISDLELASRLSFFLWSSIPDDALLELAERGELSSPAVLDAQVRRMLADPRADSLVTSFASQWLYLRNLDSLTPDMRLFPDFDDNLRQALRRETQLLFGEVIRQDRSVLDLLRADFTYLNERLAKHYGIPHIYGDRFRRVQLASNSRRGGLLRQGSILAVTSYATRTSPVIRGDWILENLVGTPPPPPPPNVPALIENSVAASLPIRQRLAMHRENPSCASCHQLIDPVGFALENYDAVGRWRDFIAGEPVDVSGGLPDGSRFQGVEGLEQALLAQPAVFAGTLVEKLMTFALGRGVDHRDAPAVRQILRDARESDYRFSALVRGIVHSTAFKMRMSE